METETMTFTEVQDNMWYNLKEGIEFDVTPDNLRRAFRACRRRKSYDLISIGLEFHIPLWMLLEHLTHKKSVDTIIGEYMRRKLGQ